MDWAVGLTTVPSRRETHLPRTLASLARAGFDTPHLFVDNYHGPAYAAYGHRVTCRFPAVRVAANWILSLAELYYRDPWADRYAVFQDDLVCVRNLRPYLERRKCPENGYWNLFTFPVNEPAGLRKDGLPAPADGFRGFYESNQRGKGAVALVFGRPAVKLLMTSEHIWGRAQDHHRGWKAIDGGIVQTFINAGGKEYVHAPSLVQHTGDVSTFCKHRHLTKDAVGGEPFVWGKELRAGTFPGEEFDALSLLSGATG